MRWNRVEPNEIQIRDVNRPDIFPLLGVGQLPAIFVCVQPKRLRHMSASATASFENRSATFAPSTPAGTRRAGPGAVFSEVPSREKFLRRVQPYRQSKTYFRRRDRPTAGFAGGFAGMEKKR